jgi:hypothetical protein
VFAPAPYALKLIQASSIPPTLAQRDEHCAIPQERGLRPYMLTKPSLLKEFPGIETAYPNAVVIADAEAPPPA